MTEIDLTGLKRRLQTRAPWDPLKIVATGLPDRLSRQEYLGILPTLLHLSKQTGDAR
jgi:hypothetical protein